MRPLWKQITVTSLGCLLGILVGASVVAAVLLPSASRREQECLVALARCRQAEQLAVVFRSDNEALKQRVSVLERRVAFLTDVLTSSNVPVP